jgi:glucokinase
VPYLGLDLGGTKIYGVLLNGDDIKEQGKRKTPPDGGPQAVVQAMADLVDELGGAKHIKGIGIGAPGLIDRQRGILKRAPNLEGWENDFPLGPALAEALGADIPVLLANDVEAGVVGEHRMGAARGRRNVLGMWLGTGVGGGLVLNGDIHRGTRGMAGEIGHIIVEPGGRPCGCGGLGHLESYAGRASMEREARRQASAGRETKLIELAGEGRMKSSVFGKALEAGDPLTIELVEAAIAAVSAAVASVQTLLDLEQVVLGGGMAERLGDVLAPRVEKAARTLTFVHDADFAVSPATLGDAAGAVGAALLAADAGR